MTLETIEAIEKEIERFEIRLDAAKTRLQADKSLQWSGCKETGALKRSALDLKNELTKLNKTQYD